ncbi:MAG: hypothetical protein KGI37_06875 [Alphaproteobacteria bacterium]|nr:hypothetical protein [Alphaproteobacteria bacterium]
MKKFLAAAILAAALNPAAAHAQGAAPGLYAVGDIILEPARFPDPKAANSCGLSNDGIVDALTKAFAGTQIPVTVAAIARPPQMGVARIDLIPEIYTHVGDSLNCVSFVSLSAESPANVTIPPVATPRGITALYWQQSTMVASDQTNHAQTVNDVLQKMAAQFTQEYRVAQPPVLPTVAPSIPAIAK